MTIVELRRMGIIVPVLVPMMIQGFYPRLWYQTKVKILSFDFYICFHHLFTNIGPSTRLSIGPSISFYVWILYLNVKYKILYLVPIFNFLVWFIVGERVENFSAKLPAQNYQHKITSKKTTQNPIPKTALEPPTTILLTVQAKCNVCVSQASEAFFLRI